MDEWFIVETIHGQVDVYTARDHFSALMKAVRRFGGIENLKSQPRPATKEDLLQRVADSAGAIDARSDRG